MEDGKGIEIMRLFGKVSARKKCEENLSEIRRSPWYKTGAALALAAMLGSASVAYGATAPQIQAHDVKVSPITQTTNSANQELMEKVAKIKFCDIPEFMGKQFKRWHSSEASDDTIYWSPENKAKSDDLMWKTSFLLIITEELW